MRTFFTAVAAVGLLAGAACGGGSKEKPASPPAGGAAPATVVKAEGTMWSPNDITVKTGDVVEWNVAGSIVHNLEGDEGVSHKAGSTFSVTHKFTKAGTFSYQCTIHSGMTGTITVS